jgi:SAM-dependent methyltransferase
MARGGVIVEVASALGAPARFVARRFGTTVVCIDMDPRMHAAAAETNRQEGLQHIVRPVLARTEWLPLATGSCDGAWSQDALCHMDKSPVLREVARVLKNGGVFAFTDFIAKPAMTEADLQVLRQLLAFPSVFSIPRYVAELDACGFEVQLAEDRTDVLLANRTRGQADDEIWWRDFRERWGAPELQRRIEAGQAWQSLLQSGRSGYGMFIARRSV